MQDDVDVEASGGGGGGGCEDDAEEEDDSLPVAVVELSRLKQAEKARETQSTTVTPPTSPPTTPSTDDNDNSWGKIKKKTSPVVNASLVALYSAFSAMFIFGWLSINSCPVNRLIPVYLIVAGSTGILTKALVRTKNKYLFNVVILLVLFDLAWQAFGSYIVYAVYQPNYDPTSGAPYCHRTAYLLAFWAVTIVYALIGLFIVLSGCYFLMRNTFRKPN